MTKLLETKPRFYIIAARSSRDLADMTATLALVATDNPSLTWLTGYGFYDEKSEPVAVVFTYRASIARAIARAHGQHSYLAVAENDRTAYEVETDTDYHVCLGKFREVSEREALRSPAFTFVDGTFYVASGGGKSLPEGF